MEFLVQTHLSSPSKAKEFPAFLVNLLPLYSEPCSFVHGGLDADRALFSEGEETQRITRNVSVAEQAWSIAATIKLLSLIVLYQFDKKFGPPYHMINRIFKKGPNAKIEPSPSRIAPSMG